MKTDRVTTFLIMLAIVLLSTALLASRIDQSYDGYLSFNEAWYSLIAQNYDHFSWFEPHPYPDKLDLNVPPFYSYMLDVVDSALAPEEWAYRLVSIFMGVYCVILVFFIGRAAYGARAGFAASALLAVCPVFVLTARNVQTDGAFLCMILAGFHFYFQYLRNRNPGTMVFSALIFGAALFTKQFALVSVAALGIAEYINSKGKILYPKRLFIFILMLLIIPGHYYIYHLIKHPHLLFSATAGGALSTAEIPSLATLKVLFSEMFFGFGPGLFILGFGAMAVMLIRRRAVEPIIILPLVLHLIFFLVVHKHTYYMVAMAPFLCLLAGRLVAGFRLNTVAAAVITLLLGMGLIQSFMVLGALKFGYNRFAQVCHDVEHNPGASKLVVEDGIMLNAEPALRYYCRDTEVVGMSAFTKNYPPGALPLDQELDTYYFLTVYSGDKLESPYTRYYDKHIMGPALFGRMVYYIPFEVGGRMLSFTPMAVHTKTVNTSRPFDIMVAETQPGFMLYRLPPGVRVYKRSPEQVNKYKGLITFGQP